jgi:hypothetical protein
MEQGEWMHGSREEDDECDMRHTQSFAFQAYYHTPVCTSAPPESAVQPARPGEQTREFRHSSGRSAASLRARG